MVPSATPVLLTAHARRITVMMAERALLPLGRNRARCTMVVRGMSRAFGFCLIATNLGWAQALPTSATIESVPIELTMPERYRVGSVLEPVRRVELVAPADGVVRSLDARPGSTVRDTQELAQLDRSEAMARLKMAQADVKEKQAVARAASGGGVGGVPQEVAAAQLEAA